ncbi:MAG: hypothetical protein DRN12_07140, partial [Thermoplasmata archaeon]
LTFNVTKVNIHFNYVSGNNTVINRNDSKVNSSKLLSTQIWDDDLNNYTTALDNATEVFLYITIDGTTYNEEHENKNATHYYLSFNPGCTYSAGKQKWKMNTTSDCYSDASSDEFIVLIHGDLRNTLLKPDGTVNYSRGDIIELNGTIIDDCDNPVSGAKVRFKLQAESGVYYCPNATGYVTNLTGNLYSCQWNSSEAPSGGWFNVSMISWKDYYNNATILRDNAFFLTTPVVLENPQHFAQQDGGWGEQHNFSINVTHYAPVNVCLLEKMTGTSNYTITECKYVSNPDGSAVIFNRTYTCSNYQEAVLKYYKFNATQPDVPATYAESSESTHILQKDDIEITHTYGNNQSVNRSYGSIDLIVQVLDTDSGKYAYVALYNSPTLRFAIYNGSAYIVDGNAYSNSSGHVKYTFSPSCSYEVGRQAWYTYTSGDSCFKDKVSDTYNLTILGFLVPDITYPNGETFIRYNELYVPINGTVRDECSLHNISTANVTFSVKSVAYGSSYSCWPVENQTNGVYNCTLNAITIEQGWYNVYMNTSNTSLIMYYNKGNTSKSYAFRVVQSWVPPELKNETVTASDDFGWGEIYVFSVNVSDLNAEDVNVTLWLSSDNVSWTLVNWTICYDCGVEQKISFTYHQYTCNDMGTQYFKFNATDPHNETDRPSINFTLYADDVEIIYVYGNESEVNRSESTLLQVKINDTDIASLVGSGINVSFWVTTDQSLWDSGYINETDSSSVASYYFIPQCTYNVGLQYWKTGTKDNKCYKDMNSSNYVLYIYGWLRNNVTQPNGNVYSSNSNVSIFGNVSDECGVAITNANVSFNVTHDSFEDTCHPVENRGDGSYNCTWNISNNPSGWYSIKMKSNATWYNQNITIFTNKFFHQVSPVLSGHYVTPVEAPWGATEFPRTFKVNVTDDDDTVTVYLWHRKLPSGAWQQADSKICSDCINKTVTFLSSDFGKYTQSDVGTWEWKINASDSYNGVAETSIKTLNVTKRNVTFQYVAGNESNVSRVGTNTTILSLLVRDAVSGSVLSGVSGGFWVTTDGSNYGSKIAASISSGYLNISFEPGCNYNVGIQYWKGGFDGSNLYYAANSTVNESLANLVLNIHGILSAEVLQPVNAEPYPRGETITIIGRVSDDCTQTTGNYVSGATVKFRVSQGASMYTPSPDPASDAGDGNYTTSWDSTGVNLGLYDITMNVSKNYYNNTVSIVEIDALRIGEKPELINPASDKRQDG